MHTVCSSDVLTQCSLAQAEYQDWMNQGLKLNMARGKPGRQQLDLVSGLLTALTDPAECFDDGIDARNYGEIAGLSSARSLFAELLGCLPEQVFVGGNSSLTLMYDTIAKAMTHGLLHSERPWSQQKGLKWLCPAPGYDRHFKITESFGFELITVPMTPEGPDMDVVEQLIQDPCVKGMWNVPKYSNPDGIVYSAQTVQRLAAMKPAAPDFLLMWDNAYCVHEFEGEFLPFADIIGLCAQNGNPDMVFEYASTSKITIPGAGVACFACSQANMEYMLRLLDVQVISYDTHGLCHLGVDGGVLQEGVGQSLGLQVFNGLLQGDHVRLVDGVDAQQQGRAVGHGGVLPLLGQHGRPVGIDVRLVKAPLDAEGLAQIELVGPAP
ncbi:aminotransferase class I/II-fold pyridoxal phosphate-dependent enzyme [Flintibacter porci]|uniref:aminotransferase class I/II-fold pyridoxal phosphate-dependent enzyme n=1 Tax=Flintibacter porci TaxID=3342383 RepID=UPI003F8C7D78